ncbi:FlgO family outer membrane protein [Alteromonas lipotrueiana]|uniref:FlgO family outer membrane protein n=1 Tax=Alteromonas lipotrueiana TaxID=2803815 RepID=UPI001C492A43|nr:FlgO family outer membrane protein [Alteromonas lipotrueiana]
MKFTRIISLLPLLVVSGCGLLYSADNTQLHHQDSAKRNTSDTPDAAEDSGLQYRPDSRDNSQISNMRVATRYQDPLVTGFYASQTHKPLYDYADQLAMKLMASASGLKTAKIGITSFVRLNASLQQTTVLGNQLAEYLMVGLQDYGVSVIEYKLAPSLAVTPYGDIALTRDARMLKTSASIDHILTGTLVEMPRGVQVNARIVAIETGQLVAATSLQIPAFMVTSLNQPQP